MKVTRCWLGSALVALVSSSLPAQTTLFSENFGAPTVTTAVGSYTGYQNYGTLGFSGTADVRGTTTSNYSGASGSGNVFLTTGGTASFTVSGINTSSLQAGSINLTFGAYKNTTASSLSDLVLEYSTDGVTYTALSITPQATGSGTAIWRSITLTSTAIPSASSLSLRWTNTGTTTQYRLDDISITGSAIPEPSTYATIAGAAALSFAAWRRRRTPG